jgi:hypothetical protein
MGAPVYAILETNRLAILAQTRWITGILAVHRFCRIGR